MAKTQTLDRLIAAATRLKSLRAEIAQIESEFPGLAGLEGGPSGRRPGRPRASNAGTASEQPTKRKRKMSAAARKAIGDAQRRRWAKQKAEAGKAR
jgi:hypothetical protein